MVVGRIHFFVCHWPAMILNFLPHGPLLGHLEQWLASSEWVNEKTERASTRKMEITLFYNLILEALSHHFCHILFIGSNSLGSALKRWGVTQECSCQETRVIGAIIEANCKILPSTLLDNANVISTLYMSVSSVWECLLLHIWWCVELSCGFNLYFLGC